jgi:hypothetical protein
VARCGPRTSPDPLHTGTPLGLDGSFGILIDARNARKFQRCPHLARVSPQDACHRVSSGAVTQSAFLS